MANFDKNRFRTVKQNWETPDELFQFLDDIYHFTIDLAGDANNTKCVEYYSKEDDALSKSWEGSCWLNPPYGNTTPKLKDWVVKAYNETRKENCRVVMLIPARTNTVWWHDYCMKAKSIWLIKGRPKFKGCVHGLPQPLAIIVFEKTTEECKLKTLDLKNCSPIPPTN